VDVVLKQLHFLVQVDLRVLFEVCNVIDVVDVGVDLDLILIALDGFNGLDVVEEGLIRDAAVGQQGLGVIRLEEYLVLEVGNHTRVVLGED